MSEMKTLTLNGKKYIVADPDQPGLEEQVIKNFAVTAILCTAEGESIAVSDAAAYPLQGLTVYGKSVQDGVGTPDAPVPIASAGVERGEINVLLRDKLLIAEQPKDTSVAMGDTAVFTVKAEGKGLTYQWQFFSKYDSAVWSDLAQEGCKTDVINIVADINKSGYQYRCVVTDASGNQVISKPAFLTIGSTSAITIMEQPKDAVLGLEETAVFTIKAVDVEGFSSAYRWQYRLTTGSGWHNTSMTGANTPELRVPAQANDTVRFGYKYRCVITDGNGNSFCTRTVTLYNRETFTGVNDFPEDAQVLTISTPNGLPGLPVSSGGNYTDENGQMWLSDTITEQMLLHSVFDGSEDEAWQQRSNTNVHIFSLANPFGAQYAGMVNVPAMANYGCRGTVSSISSVTEGCWLYWNSTSASGNTLYVYHPSCSTLDEFKAKLAEQPLEIIAQAAEPVAKELDSEIAAAIEALHTYKPNTTIVNDAGAGMKVEYVADPKTYIDNKFAQLAVAVAGS